MKNPIVSVIVTTYNQQGTIEACLDSILQQETDFEIEILVGDDCSTDNTQKIVLDYTQKDKRINYIRSANNLVSKGYSISLILLLPIAKGEYVAFCEGDDYWTDKHKLQYQVDFMKKNMLYSACYCSYDILLNDKIICKQSGRKDSDAHLSDMINLMHCQLSTFLMRTCSINMSKLQQYFIHPTHCYGDINYYTACSDRGKIRYLAKKCSIYRKHTRSITYKDQTQKIEIDKHIGGINALIQVYGEKYSYLLTDYKSRQLLDSSSLSKNKSIIYSIWLKFKAFMQSPKFIWRIYALKWNLK